MRILWLAGLALAVGTTASAQQSVLQSRVDSIFRRFDSPQSPGCAVGVVQKDQLILARGYGMSNLEHGVPITPASIFHVASISKQFTAAAIVLLAQQGKLTVEDDIRKHIPELPDFGQRITIRHLLHHTSGLRDQWSLLGLAGWRPDDPKSEADIMGLISRQRELNFVPGAQYLYSNTGYTLLAVIVKRVSGKTLREFADENIFKPLGMTSTHFHDDHTMIVPNRTSAYVQRAGGSYAISIPVFDNHGATSLFTTVEDLAKWNRNFDEPRVGGSKLVELMQTKGVLTDGETLPYAFGIVKDNYNGLVTVGHGGADAGYRADYLRFPEQGYAFITLCNLGSAVPGDLNRRVAAVYLGDRMTTASRPTTPQSVPVTRAQLEGFAGIYFDANTETLAPVSLRDGKLHWGLTNEPMASVGIGAFRMERRPVTVVFSGRGTQLIAEVRPDGARPVKLERMRDRPTAQDLKAFEGTYYSPELDVTWTLVAADGRLMLKRKRFDDSPLAPSYADAFTGVGLFRFSRDNQGRVDGFRFGNGRVRNLRFERQR
ncbi:MAG: serine hydrolase domain-containing protein [Gemmatimonadota bacterium]